MTEHDNWPDQFNVEELFRPDNPAPSSIGQPLIRQLVIDLQTCNLRSEQQLKILGKIKTTLTQQLEPDAAEYLDRQLIALAAFCGQ